MSGYEDEIVEDRGDHDIHLDSGLRHRIPWSDRVSLSSEVPGLHEVKELLEDDDASCLAEEEDGVGCPLPSTPEDDHLLDCEMTEVLKAGVLSDEIDLGALAHNAAEQAEEFVRKVRKVLVPKFLFYIHSFSPEQLKQFCNLASFCAIYHEFIHLYTIFFLGFEHRSGKHRGSNATLEIYPDGYKTMTFCTRDTGRLYHRFTPASRASFEFTRRLAIYGLIYWVNARRNCNKFSLFFSFEIKKKSIIPGKFCNRLLTEILIEVPISHSLTEFDQHFNR